MIKNIPYLVCAYGIGFLADTYSAKGIAFYLGVVLLVLLIIQGVIFGKRRLYA
jgi:hypothetical protein